MSERSKVNTIIPSHRSVSFSHPSALSGFKSLLPFVSLEVLLAFQVPFSGPDFRPPVLKRASFQEAGPYSLKSGSYSPNPALTARNRVPFREQYLKSGPKAASERVVGRLKSKRSET